MIELATSSQTIAAPVDVVFKYVSNMENYKEWFPGVIEIKSGNNLSHGEVGKTYLETLSLPGGDVALEIKVDQCDTNQLFLMKGDLPGILTQMTVKFSVNEEEHCEVHLQYHSRNPELTPASDIVIALREDISPRAHQGLFKLKEIMENRG